MGMSGHEGNLGKQESSTYLVAPSRSQEVVDIYIGLGEGLEYLNIQTSINTKHSSEQFSFKLSSSYNTLNSHGGYYTSLLSQDVADDFVSDDYVLVDNEAVQSPVLHEMSSQVTKRCRSKNFSEEEDTLLVSAYLNVSKDPITGRDQKDGTFWERVCKYFHKNRTFESDRNWSSLKHRWGIIQKEVNIFQQYYDAIERKNESGKTSDDKLAEAKAKFREDHQGKAFSVFHAWIILRHEPKWTFRDSKLKDLHEANCNGPVNADRPLGRKAEKEKARARKHDGCDADGDFFFEEVKKMREAREESEKDRKARDDKFYELEMTKVQLEQNRQDKEIMLTDTSTMDDDSKLYFKMMKQEILARRFGSS
ncbi:uncharacterized protein [Zea mays]|uniref:uncharacterized protein n=1 Tax=Zea mays TaxID=4577 RepID=UPI0009AACCA5|nr:uncharacterized protein LOC103654908 [Zea mays]|eukprot:XP_020407962.1 uncharacterized protein LOC103654908 [Zea mays]